MLVFFFFSSRRRHTRFDCDWSSDVCSSDLMLVSVTERTREIGVRMAVGARQSDIRQQFLIEAVLVCLLGGVLGIGLALLLGSMIGRFASDFQVLFSTASIVAAFACSTLIGVAFGFLPARNAAQLDPVEALARE